MVVTHIEPCAEDALYSEALTKCHGTVSHLERKTLRDRRVCMEAADIYQNASAVIQGLRGSTLQSRHLRYLRQYVDVATIIRWSKRFWIGELC